MKSSLSRVKNSYRPDIDGLRAVAVLAVVLYHAFPKEVRGGFAGVDVFFVISGFLISSLILAEIAEDRFSIAGFYVRRVRRIFPALAVCLGFVLAFGFVYLLPFEFAQLGKHVFFGASFLSNVALWSESGYFDSEAHLKPLLHLWSLGIEEQFYIVWPALLLIIFRARVKLELVLVLLLLMSFAANVVLARTDISADFYLPISRFWELLAGAALAMLRPTETASRARSLASILGLVALLGSFAFFAADMRFPGWLALLPVAGTTALIWAGPNAVVNQNILSTRAAVLIGLISYPLYLWHWPLISFAYIFRAGKPPTALMAAALVAASFLLAWATYRLVECPVRFGAHRRRRTMLAAISVATLGLAGLTTWMANGFSGRFPGLDIRKISEAKADADFKATKGMHVSDNDGTLIAQIGRGERRVALGGDSLLFHYGPRVQQIADDGQLAATTYFVTGGSCAPVPGIIQRDYFAHCANLPGLLADLVKREKVQTVVLGASWTGYSGDGLLIERTGRQLSLGTEEGRNAFYANLEDYVRMLQAEGAQVYLVLGLPIHGRFNPNAMVSRSMAGVRVAADAGDPVPVEALRAANAGVDARLRLIAERTGAKLLDPMSDICGDGKGCSPFIGAGDLKFSDGMHLRPAFVREYLRFLDFLLK